MNPMFKRFPERVISPIIGSPMVKVILLLSDVGAPIERFLRSFPAVANTFLSGICWAKTLLTIANTKHLANNFFIFIYYPILLIIENTTKNEIMLRMTVTPTPQSAALPADVAFLGDLSRSVR